MEVRPKQGLLGAATVHATATARPEDPALVEALAVVREKPRSARSLVDRLGRDARDRLADRLVERGVLEQRRDKVLGLFPRTTWPAVDSTHEDEVRRRLGDVLTTAQEPDERTAALVALLSAVDQAHRVVDHPGASNGQVKKRAEQVADGDWAAAAVKSSVQAARAATIAAVAAGGAAASSS